MRDWIYLAICIAGVAVIVWAVIKVVKRDELERRVLALTDAMLTPTGVRILVEEGAHWGHGDPEAIVDGLHRCLMKSVNAGYTKAIEPSQYAIAVLRGEYVPGHASLRGLKIPAKSYAGSAYDKDGFVYAIGMFLDPDHGGRNVIVVSDQLDSLPLIEAVEYEAEHAVLFWNDPAKYEATRYHTPENGHPLIPEHA